MLSFIMAHLFVPEPLDLLLIFLLALFLVLRVKLLFDSLDEGVEEAEEHYEEAHVRKVAVTVRILEDILKE